MSPRYKLTYFNARGVAEPIRFIFEYAGVEYEDVRFEREEWPDIKKGTPFGKVPVLEVDGKTVHQSVAICRYLAKQFKLAGDSDWESLQIDIAVDTIKDMLDAVRAAAPIIHGNGDKDVIAKKKEELANETLPFYFAKFDEIVKNNAGYFVNGKLTWVDFVWTVSSEISKGYADKEVKGSYPHLDALEEKVRQLPAIKAWIAKRPVTNH